MDRRSFISNLSAATVASIAGGATLSDKADALEDAMSIELDKRIATPWFCSIEPTPEPVAGDTRPWYQHDDPRLPEMPAAPCRVHDPPRQTVWTRRLYWPVYCMISVSEISSVPTMVIGARR